MNLANAAIANANDNASTLDDERQQPENQWICLSWMNCPEFHRKHKDQIVKAQILTTGNLKLIMKDGTTFMMKSQLFRDNDNSKQQGKNDSQPFNYDDEQDEGRTQDTDNSNKAMVTHLHLAHGMFKGFSNLREFTVADSDSLQVHLGEATFEDCVALGTVDLGRHCRVIPRCTFKNCWSFSKLDWWPPNLHTIGAFAFQGCENVQWLANLPESLKVVEEGAFEECLLVDAMVPPDNADALTIQCNAGSNDLYFCRFGTWDWDADGIANEHVCLWSSWNLDKYDASSLAHVAVHNTELGDSCKCLNFLAKLQISSHDFCLHLKGCRLPKASSLVDMVQQIQQSNVSTMNHFRVTTYVVDCTLAKNESSVGYCLSVLSCLASAEPEKYIFIELFGVSLYRTTTKLPVLHFSSEANVQAWAHYVGRNAGNSPPIDWVHFQECDITGASLGEGGRLLLKHFVANAKLELSHCRVDACALLDLGAHFEQLKQQGVGYFESSLDSEVNFSLHCCEYNGNDHTLEILDTFFHLQINCRIDGIEIKHDQKQNTAHLSLDSPNMDSVSTWLMQEEDTASPTIVCAILVDIEMDSTADDILFKLINKSPQLQHLDLTGCNFQPSCPLCSGKL